MQGLYNGGKSEILASDPCEDQLILEIEAEKQNYKDGFNKLRDLKKEIENIHHLLEQNHLKLQDDFQKWMSIMSRVEQDSKGSSLSTLPMLPSTTSNSSENTNKPTTDDRILELQPAASRGEEVVAVNNEHETSLHKLKPSVVYKTLNSENMQNKIDSSYDRFQEPKYPCAKDISEVLDPSDPRQHKEKSVYRLPLVGASETAGSSAQSKVAALLTGNPTTDAEILAFYEARDKILKLKSQNQKQ